jgi:hypothetical protein
MCILNKGSPFHWDESEQRLFDALKKDLVSTPLEQRLFDALKKALVSTPLINPPDHNRYFLLYLAATESSIGMVLV